MQGFYHHYQLPIIPTATSSLTDAQVHEWLHDKLFVQPREREIDRLIQAGQPVEAFLLATQNWEG